MIDYIISNYWLFWVIVCVICLILEISSGTFFIMCLAIGAFFSIISSFIPFPFWAQVIVFALFSVVSVYWFRPFAMKYLHRDGDTRLSNVDAIAGREGTVTDEIKAGGSGYVKIDGDEWKAITADGTPVAKGARVRVVSMDSIIVTVEKMD